MTETGANSTSYYNGVDSYAGEIRLFAGAYAPEGWLLCQGQLELILSYPHLFQAIGDAYGGDGKVTFGLPDLSMRIPVGCSNVPPPGMSRTYVQKAAGGVLDVALEEAEMPAHTHIWFASKASASTRTPSPNVTFATVVTGSTLYSRNPAPVTQETAAGMIIPNLGGSRHRNVMPSVGLNYIICFIGDPPGL